MKFLNWNIRGMIAFRKQQILVDILKDNKKDVVAIQETKKEIFFLMGVLELFPHI